jgi:hypothetical protein
MAYGKREVRQMIYECGFARSRDTHHSNHNVVRSVKALAMQSNL